MPITHRNEPRQYSIQLDDGSAASALIAVDTVQVVDEGIFIIHVGPAAALRIGTYVLPEMRAQYDRLALELVKAREQIARMQLGLARDGVVRLELAPRKIPVIKALCKALPIGIQTAKRIVDRAPCDIPCDDPDALRAALRGAGATAV